MVDATQPTGSPRRVLRWGRVARRSAAPARRGLTIAVLTSLVVLTAAITPAASALGPVLRSTEVDLGDLLTAASGRPAGWQPPATTGSARDRAQPVVLIPAFGSTGSVLRYGFDGSFDGELTPDGDTLRQAHSVAVGDDGLVYVADADGDQVLRYDPVDNSLLDVFVAAGSGGLSHPRGLAFGPDGNLVVASAGSNQLLEYDGRTGQPLGVVADGLDNPGGLVFSDDGHLIATSQNDDTVHVYIDGALQTSVDMGPGAGPVDVALDSDGTLFVALDGGRVDRLDLKGLDETEADVVLEAESFVTTGLVSPSSVAVGPDGTLWVADQWTDRVHRFDRSTGQLEETIIESDTPLGPSDLAFLPVSSMGRDRVAGNGTPVGRERGLSAGDWLGQRGPTGRRGAGGLRFEANDGRAAPDLDFVAHGRDYGVVLKGADAIVSPDGTEANAIRLAFAGAADDPAPGSLPSEAAPSVVYEDVYPGIDVTYRDSSGDLEYLVVIDPGADPDLVSFGLSNATEVELTQSGSLRIWVRSGGAMELTAPVAYQERNGTRVEVDSRFEQRSDGTFGFEVGSYDPTLALIIDPTFRASTSADSGGGNTITIARPAGVTADDVLLASIAQSKDLAITPPAGWTLIRSDTQESKVWQDLFYKVATASEPASYVFNLAGAGKSAGAIVAYDGVDTTNPIDAHGGQGNPLSTSYTAPAITPTVSGATLVAFFGNEKGSPATPPAGMTERADHQSTEGATEIADEVLGAGGATGTRTASGSSGVSVGQLVALTPDNIVGRWRLDEGSGSTAVDSSVNGHDGTITGATYTTGVSATGLDFTGGGGERVVVGDPPDGSLDPGTGDFTVSAWFRTTVVPGSGEFDQLVYKSDGSEGYELFLADGGASPRLTFRMRDGGSSWTTLHVAPMDDGGWHHAAGVMDGSNLYLYLDGTLVDSQPHAATDVDTVEQLAFGAEENGLAWSDFEGDLDEIAIYDRALTAGEIAVLSGASTVVVNSTGDASDTTPGDDLCDTGGINSEGDPECTLRAAIEEANASATVDTIHFAISTSDPGYSASPLAYTFTPAAPYDYLLQPVTLDASTQSGWTGDPIIELDGTSAVGATAGLAIRTNNSTIRGFIVHSFPDEGLEIDGSTGFGDNNTLTNNWVGFDASLTAQPNTDAGVLMTVGASGNSIGGSGADDGNVVGFGANTGIVIRNSGSDANVIIGNTVGVGPDGTTPMANTTHGVEIYDQAAANRIGGTGPGEANIIVGNGGDGVALAVDAGSGNAVLGNTLRDNGGLGIDLAGGTEDANGVTDNDAGDGDTGANDLLNQPVITSAAESGGAVTLDFDLDVPAGDYRIEFFTNAAADASGHGEGETFVHSYDVAGHSGGSGSYTTTFAGSAGDILTATTSEDLGPSYESTSEFSATFVVGSSLLVVNSGGNSVDVNPGNGLCDTGGTNSEGATECTLVAAIQEANAYAGPNDIHFALPDSDPLYRNLGVGLSYWRIQPTTPITALMDNATVIDATTQTTYAVTQGYFVNDSGPEVEVNNTGGAGGNGLEIQGDGNEIRGLVVNLFVTGINVTGGNNNLIAGNYVGTDPSGTIDSGNTSDGITIRDGATGNTIGGSTVADRNIIAGNDNDGIWITGAGTDNNIVRGNWIGFGSDGSNLGNSYHGVAVEFGAASNLVGGTTAVEANRIGNSAWDGIAFNGGNGTGNAALRNSIVNNTGLGIDIDNDGVTANDAGDGDTGDNDLLNFPVVTSATDAGGTVTVTFDLDVPAGTYRVEFFDNTTADGTGYGEGETFLSAVTVSAGTGLTHSFPGAEGDILTATTTADLGGGSHGSTSEFSAAFTVTLGNQPPVFDQDLLDRSDAEAVWISHSAAATDPDPADTLVYSATGLPLGLSIDPDTGLVSGMVNHAAAASSPYSVEISVTDGVNPAVIDTFTWTVTNVATSDPYLVAGTGGTGGGDDLLTTVDPANSDPVTNEVDIGTGTGTSGIEAAAIEPLSGVLYAVDGDQLGTLDVDSGVFTAFGPGLGTGEGEYGAVTFDDVRGLAFHPLTGVIWAVHARPGLIDVLFQINPASGAHIPDAFGPGVDYIKLRQHGGATDYTGLAIDPTDWQLYGVVSDGTGTDYLVSVRAGNGNARVIGSLAQPLTDISFDSTGQLWGIDEGALYQVAKTSGVLDAGRTIDNGAAYGALAFAVPPANPPSLEGTVFEDIDGDALAAGQFPTDATDPGVPGVTVHLYRDDGTVTGEPDTADTVFDTKVTGPTGKYFFQGLPDGTYYVVIDSTTVSPSAGGSGWAEQTYGPAGGAGFDGSYSYTVVAGPLYGGKQGAVSDDLTNAATAEHLARLALSTGVIVEDVDFGFSFNVVTNLEGADAASAQGSLRRFIDNANSITGPNTMRFVPAIATNGADGGGNTWWSVALTAALPVVTDTDTVLDAAAYDAADGSTTIDPNALGPELELDGSGVSGTGLEFAGINGEVRGFVVNRFATGIAITGGSANIIAGNYIGTRVDGVTGGVGNIIQGVLVDQSPANVIGGISAADRNVISGNRQRGVTVDDWSDGAGVTSAGTQIINNHIGVDRTGTVAVPYDGTPQYQQIGVYILDSSDTVIGTPSAGNVISGNPWYGIYAFGSNGTGNIIQNNIVGLDSAESGSIPNGTESSTRGGIYLSSTVGTVVGGAGVGEGNTIAANGFFGVVVSGASVDNSVLGNSIYGNGDLGIGLDLDGVTVNDPGDVDSGANGLLNHPALTAPVSGDTTVGFELDVPAGDYRIEVFTNPTEGADPSGHGEGESLVAAQTVTHTGSGPESFVLVVPEVFTGDVLSATATEDLGGGSFGATSEFSAAVTVVAFADPVVDASVRRSDVLAEGGLDPVSAAIGGTAGSALTFNGGGELLRGAGLNVTDTELSVSAWIRPAALGGTDYVVSKQTSGGDPVYELGVDGASQAVAALTIGGGPIVVQGGTVSVGTWHHLAVAWDGATIRLFVDGSEVDTALASGSLATEVSTDVIIGSRSDGTGGFDGEIDHVEIGHLALSAGDISVGYSMVADQALTVAVGQQQTGAPGPWTVSGVQSRSGGFALAAPETAESGAAAWAVATGIDEPGAVFETWWWVSTATGVDLASGTRAGQSATDQFDAAYIGADNWELRRRSGAADSVDGSGTQALSAGTWVEVEQWTDQNGNSRLLVDGVEVAPWTAQAAPPAAGSLGLRVGRLPGGQSWYVDDPRARRLVMPEPTATLGPLDRD